MVMEMIREFKTGKKYNNKKYLKMSAPNLKSSQVLMVNTPTCELSGHLAPTKAHVRLS